MPVIREPLSISQFAELVGVEPARLIGVEMNRQKSTVTLVLEPEEWPPYNPTCSACSPLRGRCERCKKERDIQMAQTSGTCPPLSGNTSLRKPKRKGK